MNVNNNISSSNISSGSVSNSVNVKALKSINEAQADMVERLVKQPLAAERMVSTSNVDAKGLFVDYYA